MAVPDYSSLHAVETRMEQLQPRGGDMAAEIGSTLAHWRARISDAPTPVEQAPSPDELIARLQVDLGSSR